MPTDPPTDLPSWITYVGTLSGPALLSKAIAANQVAFVRSLEKKDNLTPKDIAGVLQAFARRLIEDGQVIPGRTFGDYVDYGALAYPVDLNVDSVEG